MKAEELLELKVEHNARLRGEIIDLQRRLERLQAFVSGLCDPDQDAWHVSPGVRKKARYFLDEVQK